jgi:hypothetical protein
MALTCSTTIATESGLEVVESFSCSLQTRFEIIWISCCERMCLKNAIQANWTVARDTCCSIGLTLAVLPTKGKKMCLDKLISSKNA